VTGRYEKSREDELTDLRAEVGELCAAIRKLGFEPVRSYEEIDGVLVRNCKPVPIAKTK
jgi:hypothetical protein